MNVILIVIGVLAVLSWFIPKKGKTPKAT